MFCYQTEAFYNKLDDSKHIKDIRKSQGPIFAHLYDAIEYFKKQGFNEVSTLMWPTALGPSLVWHGRKRVSDTEHASAYVTMLEFIA